jgi:hypothetical protein
MPGSRIETRPMLTSSGTLSGGGDCIRSDATSIASPRTDAEVQEPDPPQEPAA